MVNPQYATTARVDASGRRTPPSWASGAAHIKERLQLRFQEPNLHAQLLHRIVLRHLVIDHERVTRTFPEGPGTIELVATYEVVLGRITRHWVAFGEKVLET